jgi:hypothetical protein
MNASEIYFRKRFFFQISHRFTSSEYLIYVKVKLVNCILIHVLL